MNLPASELVGLGAGPFFGAKSLFACVLATLACFSGRAAVVLGREDATPSKGKQQALAAEDSRNGSEAMTLLSAYEKTLVPYERFKGKWVERYASLKKDKEPEWLNREDEWTVCRDRDRAKSTVAFRGTKIGEKGQSREDGEEHIWAKGKPLVSIGPPFPRPDSEGSDAPIVIAELQASVEDFLTCTGFGFDGSRGMIDHDIKSIPAFLRTAKLSAERDTLDGHAVNVLRGVVDKDEITLWLDPAMGYVPRKVVYDKRSSSLKSPASLFVYEVKRFEKRSGVFVPLEAIATTQCPERPAIDRVYAEVVNGKLVTRHIPKKDANGKIVMAPATTYLTESKLVELEFDPQFADEDFKASRPVPDGTQVSVGFRVPHVTYEWRQGEIMKVVEPAIQGKFDPTADAKAEIAEKLKVAKWVKNRVLVIFGANGWRQCHALEETFQANAESLWPLLDAHHGYAYQVVLVDATTAKNRALAAEYGLTLDERKSPGVTVLESDGKPLCSQDLAAFEENGAYDATKLVAMLKKWEPPHEDAEDVLRIALEQALKEQKKPFIIFSGQHCMPCHRLIDFLNRWRQVLDKDYLLVHIEDGRMTHVEEAKTRVGFQGGMIPWYAILSPTGEKLTTSMSPKGSIGYPASKPESVKYFMTMLRQTSSHISPEQFKEIEDDLIASDKRR